MRFRLQAPFTAAGDQGPATEKLLAGFQSPVLHPPQKQPAASPAAPHTQPHPHTPAPPASAAAPHPPQKQNPHRQTLLGVTGSGKTFTMASVVEKLNMPTLVLTHNKTLAAQLYREFTNFFPDNAIEYFVSYYNYYQPEAYVPTTDTYIEKDASINDEIDRLRLRATTSLLTRNDVMVIASVSCIFGLGSPEDYRKSTVFLQVGQSVFIDDILRQLIHLQYNRNDVQLSRGMFSVRGEILDIFPAYGQEITRIFFHDEEIEKISLVQPVSGQVIADLQQASISAAKHFITSPAKITAWHRKNHGGAGGTGALL